ncbi:MAG: thioredoxin domain-containing protein [Verrucomicrobiales bacterium]
MRLLTLTVIAVVPLLCSADEKKPANRLAKEKSPYLLQHAHNPVDWYPWGDEAFGKAKKENKPVLLSIGYATCHWCHVMERESFEDPQIARFLNDHFVAIKLDREERPDIDNIYMNAMQALGLGGGWPLNAFLTPDRKPFFGGTYFPPVAGRGQAGFIDVLKRVAELWQTKESEIRQNAEQLTVELGKVLSPKEAAAGKDALNGALVAAATTEFMTEYDSKNGGFGQAPKFPQPQVLALVLRHGFNNGDSKALDAVGHTLERMAAGGIYDQIGDGFSRYSTDEKWLVPHFEKMLYDNAQLANVYLDAYTATGNARFAEVARGIFRYVLRDMTSAEGAFYSAEDADSEGHEGKFYTWTKAEMQKLLSAEEAKLALAYWGVTEEGNFVDHSHPNPLTKQNILSVVDAKRKLSAKESVLIESARKKLFEARQKRVRPLRDDKVLASWNGLMLSAFARGGIILADDALIEAAKKNAAFLRKNSWDESTKTLSHRWREGEKDSAQLLRGYAFLLRGVLDLYFCTLDPDHLEWALALAEGMIAKFYDEKAGGFFQSTEQAGLILRTKDDYDDAEPAGNSVAAWSLLDLSAVAGLKPLREKAEKTLRLMGGKLMESPTALPLMVQVVANYAQEPYRVVVAGDASSSEARQLLRAASGLYQPNKVILGTSGPVEEFAKTLSASDGKVTIYVCSGTFCHPPTSDPAKLKEYLSGKSKKPTKPAVQ